MIYKTEAIVLTGGRIILDNLPFEPGTLVNITISLKKSEEDTVDSVPEKSDD